MIEQSIRSILIANRGEIASRIIRSCKKMGIKSFAVFSDADRSSPYVSQADHAIYIGESPPSKSYLNQSLIIDIARKHQIDAIHPGYGFLSENSGFARLCKDNDIIFIGPHPEAIDAMGSKSNAKSIMADNNVPIIKGYQGKDQSSKTLIAEAKKIGFPLLLKATAGGGGKGMRIIHESEALNDGIAAAKREALSAFSDDELIIEKYISKGRHIEFQIFGDKHGNVIHLLERECSIQRRYQKVIEESPSPVLTPELRAKMGDAAVNAAKALNYDNAGTVEFIFDDTTQEFFFLEVNTRLQVEHPVTEEITGLDLVKMQIEVAEGKPLAIDQSEVTGSGYAVEARLYAEDPSNDYLPATGTVLHWGVPKVDGLRVETAIASGSEISIYYDPMIAKIIIHADDRLTAHRKMAYTLANLKCQGLTTNQDLLKQLFLNTDVNNGQYDTHFLKTFEYNSDVGESALANTLIAATLYHWNVRALQRTLLKSVPSGWRNSKYQSQIDQYQHGDTVIDVGYDYESKARFTFTVREKAYDVRLIKADGDTIDLEIDGVVHSTSIALGANGEIYVHDQLSGNITLTKVDRLPTKETEKTKGGYNAPMPSQIIKVLVSPGDEISAGQGLMIISSMKMENTIVANEDGIVKEIYTSEGQNVAAGFLLLSIKSNDNEQ